MKQPKFQGQNRLVLLGVMELARIQYSALENTRRTTAILLRDMCGAEHDSKFLSEMEDIVSDVIYGNSESVTAADRLNELAEKVERQVERRLEEQPG